MISQQVFGTLLIFIVCPILGGLPLTDWFFYLVKKKKLSQIGTGNVSVSAAFYHGGRFMGIVAVLTEASKGIVAVLLARRFFVGDPKWELLALLALVIGRYWFSQGAGITNLVWGIVLHDWRVAILTLMISGIGFTLVRERQAARMFSLFIFGLLLVLLHAGDDDTREWLSVKTESHSTGIGSFLIVLSSAIWVTDDIICCLYGLECGGVSSTVRMMLTG